MAGKDTGATKISKAQKLDIAVINEDVLMAMFAGAVTPLSAESVVTESENKVTPDGKLEQTVFKQGELEF